MALTNLLVTYAISAFALYLPSLAAPPSKLPRAVFRKTDAYGGFFALAGRLHLQTYRNHSAYGSPVVRQGPNRLVFDSATAFREIYQNERLSKSNVYKATQHRPGAWNVFNVIDKPLHRSKRRLIGQAISEQSMRSFEPTMVGQIDKFTSLIFRVSQASEPVNMSTACRHLGVDIIRQLGFGYNLNLQNNETYRFLTRALTFGNYRNSVCMQFPALFSLWPNLIAHFLPNSLRARLMDLLEKMISSRFAQPLDAKQDLLSFAAAAMGKDALESRRDDLFTEGTLFFTAGGDTTSTTLAAALFYLSRNPTCYERLAAEIRSAFDSGKEIRGGPRLTGCRYLRACIDGALRMCPPVPTTLWREMGPADDDDGRPLVIDGHVVPRGTQVGVNHYALHHNEEVFADPFAFQPDRWIEDGSDPEDVAAKKAMHHAFAAFSIGSRGCAGKARAYREASLVLARTIWYFDFEKAPGRLGEVGEGTRGKTDERGRVDEFQVFDIFAAYHDGPYLTFRPRGSVCDELDIKETFA